VASCNSFKIFRHSFGRNRVAFGLTFGSTFGRLAAGGVGEGGRRADRERERRGLGEGGRGGGDGRRVPVEQDETGFQLLLLLTEFGKLDRKEIN